MKYFSKYLSNEKVKEYCRKCLAVYSRPPSIFKDFSVGCNSTITVVPKHSQTLFYIFYMQIMFLGCFIWNLNNVIFRYALSITWKYFYAWASKELEKGMSLRQFKQFLKMNINAPGFALSHAFIN